MPTRFEAVIDIFANPEPKSYTRQPSTLNTLPSSQTIPHPHPAQLPQSYYPAQYPRLNTCNSMPNIAPNHYYQPPVNQPFRP